MHSEHMVRGKPERMRFAGAEAAADMAFSPRSEGTDSWTGVTTRSLS